MYLASFNSRTLGRVRLDGESLVVLACRFQFTHPGKGATYNGIGSVVNFQVSIYAPWEGCDPILHRPSCHTKFQFTHPGKGATDVKAFQSQR